MVRFRSLVRISLLYTLLILAPSAIAQADNSVTQAELTAQQLLQNGTKAMQSGDKSAALSELLQAKNEAPESIFVKSSLEQLVGSGLPDTITEDELAGIPVKSAMIAGGIGISVEPDDYISTQAVEPQHGWLYGRITYIEVPSSPGKTSSYTQFCRVHYTSQEVEPFARRVGALLLLAHNTLTTMIGRDPFGDDRPFDVWLCDSGQMGGEQWEDNIYFYDLTASRSSIEWIREIVHEYSHLALPAIGGYSAPEYWANGYLGERLIVRWMERSPVTKKNVEDLWGDFSGENNFNLLLIDPPLTLFHKIGPNQVWLGRTDEEGMNYFIGRMLAIDDRYGSKFLGLVLSNFPHFREAHATDLPEAIAEAEQMQSHLGS